MCELGLTKPAADGEGKREQKTPCIWPCRCLWEECCPN